MRIPSGTTDQYIYFVAVDAADFTSRETGLSSFTVYRSRNGAAAAAMTTPTVNEVDATNMPGVYELLLDEDMTIGSGNDSEEMSYHITHAGMAPVTRTIELYRPKITVGETLTVSSGVATANTTLIEGVDATDQINAACDTALTDYDAPTKAELDSGLAALNDLTAAQVNAEVDTALADIGLNHLLAASVTGTDVTDNSIVAKLVSSSATADWDDYDNTTDSLQATSAGGNAFATSAGYVGDYAEDATLEIQWMTYSRGLVASTASAATISVYKDGGATPSTAGVGTPTYNLNSVTGLNEVTIDLSADAFYATAADYAIYATMTVDSQTVTQIIGYFSIENRANDVNVTTVAGQTASAGAAVDFDDLATIEGLASGTTGFAAIDTVVDSILVDTGTTLPATLTTINNGVTGVDGKADDIYIDTQAILTDTGTTIPAQISGLNNISVNDILTTALADAYAAHGNAPTLQQAIMWIHQSLDEKGISGTTVTVQKLDGTTAGTLTLNDASAPTTITRAT